MIIDLKYGKFAGALTVAFGLFALAPSAATAALLFIDDTTEMITITATGFEGGFTGAGTFSEGTPLSFSGSWFDGSGLAVAGTRTIFLIESVASGAVSDILRFTIVPGSFTGAFATISGNFTSESEGQDLGPPPPGVLPINVFVENGTPVRFDQAFLSVVVHSDAEVVVPEPGTIVVFALGLAGLGWSRRKKA